MEGKYGSAPGDPALPLDLDGLFPPSEEDVRAVLDGGHVTEPRTPEED